MTGFETSFFKGDREISEDVRPHGSTSPSGRGRIVRRVLSHANICQRVVPLTAHDTESEPATKITEFIQRRAEAHPLLGGEGRGEGERELYLHCNRRGT